MAGLFLDIFIEYLFRVMLRGIRLLRSRNWPIAKATVLSSACPRATSGCTVANVDYEYTVEGVNYADSFEKPFFDLGSGMLYAQQFAKGSDFGVRVKSGDPSLSVAASQDRT
jgi:hypothetical protein